MRPLFFSRSFFIIALFLSFCLTALFGITLPIKNDHIFSVTQASPLHRVHYAQCTMLYMYEILHSIQKSITKMSRLKQYLLISSQLKSSISINHIVNLSATADGCL